MSSTRGNVFTVILFVLVNTFAVPTFSAEPLPVSEIRPGMKGVFHTIIAGDKPEPIDFEVVDVLPSSAPGGGPLILVRATGENARKAGGIAQGMSGSPAFIGDRIMGAISTGFPFADPFIGGITPYEEMTASLPDQGVKASDWIDQGAIPGLGAQATASRTSNRRTLISLDQAIADSFPFSATPLSFYTNAPPDSRTFAFLKTLFRTRLPRATLASTSGNGESPLPYSPEHLKPGDSVAYILSHGIFPLYAFGTVTDVLPDGRFLAFGHSALNSGEVSVPAGKVYVSTTVSSIEAGFKLGRPLSINGFFASDRGPAVGGVFGSEPQTLPMRVSIVDEATGRNHEFHEEIAPMEFAFAPLAALTVIQSAERALLRSGKGAAEYEFSIYADGLSTIHWTDHATQFYTLSSPSAPVMLSSRDIVSSIAVDLYDLLSTLLGNPYARVLPRKIEFSARITPEESVALVDDLQFISPVPLKGPLRLEPGSRVETRVTIRRFRGTRETYDLTLAIPANLTPGSYLLVAYGGSRMPTAFPTQAEHEGEIAVIAYSEALRRSRRVRSAQDLADAWFRKDKNSEIVLRLIPAQFAEERDDDNLPPEPPNVSVSRDLGTFVMGFVSQPVEIGRKGRERVTRAPSSGPAIP
ncbi:MAG: hypothetical protein V2G42_08285 [bacterium JZ-2024 1]